ncbi:MAG: alpha-galactosidase [Clostridia bacterium]|nr:alpha-galactosidase [Clostridia bacterium]
MAIRYDAQTRSFFLNTCAASYVMHVTEDGHLLNLHWGAKIEPCDLRGLLTGYLEGASFDSADSRLPYETPTRSGCFYGAPAVDVIQPSGDTVTELKYDSHRIVPGKPALAGLPATYAESDDEAETLIITLIDPLTGLRVEESYTVFAHSGALARSKRIVNGGSAAISLTGAMSGTATLWGDGYEILHLKGGWARERHVVRTPVGQGAYRIGSARGASGHEHNPFIALVRPQTTEFSGEVWAMNFVYSGSFSASADVSNDGQTHMRMGMNSDVFRWQLGPGEAFQCPECVLCYSGDGLNAMSRQLHELYRARLCRGEWRDKDRPVLINNWEATYFDFNEDKLLSIARVAADIGVELFVLDDGWFGHRDTDNCSLGDWVPDARKLPGGIRGVAEKINALGLKFGLWFEPEMISPDSDLYRAHPDWCLHVDGRPRTEARQQLILDLARTEVQDYVIDSVSAVLDSANIEYVKWDMNRNMSEAFSTLPAAQQLETQHRYMLGLYRVLEAITGRFPHILFESCSGGGGRFDAGMLYYMPQTWTSDDTDPVERLKIQYGTSLAYPTCAMGAHVSASPSHQTGRVTPMRMRGDVAIGGNFGFELDLSRQTPEDVKTARRLIEEVKSLRTLTRTGAFTRLVSPFEGNFAAWQFADAAQDELLVCFYQRLSMPNPTAFRLKIECDDRAVYADDEGNRYAGAMLHRIGLTILPANSDFASKIVHLRRI